ncbi:hypothetical protein M9H77_16885 [Catharanthus roseus]|uniref:Uncharacterized protein n=1 Tax=Catharanthus roseus TaxID=4058 RepID=A0ACC0B310_CATRO|nr:hypothetical protein M9H77_16885 [Catharanthus roseus]
MFLVVCTVRNSILGLGRLWPRNVAPKSLKMNELNLCMTVGWKGMRVLECFNNAISQLQHFNTEAAVKMETMKQIRRQGLYYKIDAGYSYEMVKYFLGKYDRFELTRIVELTKNSVLTECSLIKLESKDLPCSHMFRCMVIEHMQSIPSPCILNHGHARMVTGKILVVKYPKQ